jgi:hypothetical protein
MAFEISGETGKAMNATKRTLAALRISACELKFQSLGDDSLTWTASTDDATGTGTVIPEAGQIVELWDGSTRLFKGHCTKPVVGLKQVRVTVLGPWWWMTRIAISGDNADGNGTTAERTSYVIPQRGLASSIQLLVERAIDKGVPIAFGSVSAMYQCPKMSLSNMSFASALAELMRWCPDAVARFDYSGSTPALHVTRRGAMSSLTYTIGTHAIEDMDIAPRLDLEVSQVKLKYVDRKPGNGKTRWQEQTYGTGAAGKRQIITVSGPEITDFLPKDDFASVRVQTVAWNEMGPNFIKSKDPFLSSVKNAFGGVVNYFVYYTGSSKKKTRVAVPFPVRQIRSVTGKPLTANQKWFVRSEDPLPEWAQKQLNAAEVIVTGTWGASWTSTTSWTQAFKEMMGGASYVIKNAWRNEQAEPFSGWDDRIDYIARPFEIRGWVINSEKSSLTTIYKNWDYDYISPPAGLAQDLREAQNWIPYEGRLTIAQDEVDCVNRMNRKLRVANAYAPYATMDAILRSMSYDIVRGRMTFDMGAPARTDLGSMISRVRRNPQDNIVFL